jgi:hypothetical protein
MKRCDLMTSSGRIRHALENLEAVWQQSADQWDDAASREFAERHLEPMLPKLKLALDAIARMQGLMTEVQRDCEE